MTHEYTTTFADYKAAQKLFLRHSVNARRKFLGWMYGLPMLTILLFVALFLSSRRSDTSGFAILGWLTLCSAVVTVNAVILRPWNLKRAFRKSQRMARGVNGPREVRFDFDDQGVNVSVPGRSVARFFWGSIEDFAENDSIALLFVSKKQFLFIPKRALDDLDWERLRHTIHEQRPELPC